MYMIIKGHFLKFTLNDISSTLILNHVHQHELV